jgi:CheY-like chemotaxis protein
MSRRNPNLEDPEAICMVLQRICRDGVTVQLRSGQWLGEFSLQAVDLANLIFAFPEVTRGQWGLKKGGHVSATFVDRGKAFEGLLPLVSTLRYKGEESCQFEIPRALRAVDPHRLADFVPDHPVHCLFSSAEHDVVEGRAFAFGLEGLEAGPQEGRDLARTLKVGHPSMVELMLHEQKLVLPSKVKYLDRTTAGFLFEKLDRAVEGAYQSWLLEAEREQQRRDREAFSPGGVEAPAAHVEQSPRLGGRLQIWTDRAPMVLVVSEGEALPRRLAESLGRKFGFASLDYVQGPIHPLLGPLGGGLADWGRTRLLLVHQRLRVTSGLDLTRQLTQAEGCPLPVLLVGTEDDAEVKRNRAIAAGAVDFLVIEPYHVVKVMRAIEETLRMFS